MLAEQSSFRFQPITTITYYWYFVRVIFLKKSNLEDLWPTIEAYLICTCHSNQDAQPQV